MLVQICLASHSMASVGDLLDALEFKSPIDGVVQRSDRFELVSQESIYQEDYMYGGSAPVSTASWHINPLHYLYKRTGTVNCTDNASFVVDSNIPGNDLKHLPLAAAPTTALCAAACEAQSGCRGFTFDPRYNSVGGCWLKRAVTSFEEYAGDTSGCSAHGEHLQMKPF